MNMLRVARHARALGASALAVIAITACSKTTKLEDQDAFKTQAARVERSANDINAIRLQLQVLDRDLKQVTSDVGVMSKQGGGAGQADMAALAQRVQQLESNLKTTGEAVASFEQRLSKLERGGSARATAPSPSEEQEKTENGKALVISRRNGKAGTSRAEAQAEDATGTRTPSRATSPVRGGFYHEMASGETVGSVARQYKVSVNSIRAANGIPAGKEPMAGQRIYVPRSE